MSNPTKIFLLIDGDYFCHRTLHGIRIHDKEFNLTTPGQKQVFINQLKNSVITTFEAFKDHIYNMIFVFDNKSWRKNIEGFRPYYMKTDEFINTSVGYKGNRKDLKESSDIDYDVFGDCCDEFSDYLKGFLTVFKEIGYEGDDMLMMLSKQITSESPDNYCCVLCTDNDLQQITSNQTFIYLNSASKDYPHGKIIVSEGMYQRLFGVNQLQRLTETNTFYDDIMNVFRVSLKTNNKIQRTAGVDIQIAEPIKNGFVKVICGDKKDNILPLLRWKKGTRNFSVTEKMLIKACNQYSIEFTEKNMENLLKDKISLSNLLIELVDATGQKDLVKINDLGSHYKHNLKIMLLTEENLPVDVHARFSPLYLNLYSKLYTRLNMEDVRLLNLNDTTDSSQDIMKMSIPTIL